MRAAILILACLVLAAPAQADDKRSVIEHDLGIMTQIMYGAPKRATTACGQKTLKQRRYCYTTWRRDSITKCRVRWIVRRFDYFGDDYEANCIPVWLPYPTKGV